MKYGRAMVSVIILNWNEGAYILKCLDCVLGQSYQDIEMIVVDQGSVDGSVELISERYPQCKVIRNAANVGFAQGMNQGINASNGEYVLMLNADAFLHSDFIWHAVSIFQRLESRKVGMVSGKVYRHTNSEPTREIASLGTFLLKRMTVVSGSYGDREEYVFGPAGCCPIVRREMLEDTRLPSGDYFDSTFFAFCEDIDLWLRAQIRGWKCIFTPEVIAWHIQGGSTAGRFRFYERPKELQVHWRKNRIICFLGNIPVALFPNVLLPFLVAEVSLWGYALLSHPSLVRPFVKAHSLVLMMLPSIIRKRRYVLKRRTVSYSYLRSLFVGP